MEEARVLSKETVDVKPPYELKFSQDGLTGLREATLAIYLGFPDKYLGEYAFKEWNYGEKLNVELEASKQSPEKMDVTLLIVLQTLITLRKSPISLKTVEDYKNLPGRLGTLLTNIASFLNLSPSEEKKS